MSASQRFLWWFSVVVLLSVFIMALFAPLLSPYPDDHRDEGALLARPSNAHWLGTDENGSDILTLIIYGSRVTVAVGLGTVALCLLVGLAIGLVSGYVGGVTDEVIMRFTEVLMSFPGILLAILIIFVTQSPGIVSVIGALSVTGWAGYARLVRGQVMQVKELEFVRATRALGAGWPRLLIIHILPNTLAPVLVQATFGVAGAILAEASLSFLGLGPDKPVSWGAMLDQGAVLFVKNPYLAIVPGLAIFLVVLAVNFLGDLLRDRLDTTRDTQGVEA